MERESAMINIGSIWRNSMQGHCFAVNSNVLAATVVLVACEIATAGLLERQSAIVRGVVVKVTKKQQKEKADVFLGKVRIKRVYAGLKILKGQTFTARSWNDPPRWITFPIRPRLRKGEEALWLIGYDQQSDQGGAAGDGQRITRIGVVEGWHYDVWWPIRDVQNGSAKGYYGPSIAEGKRIVTLFASATEASSDRRRRLVSDALEPGATALNMAALYIAEETEDAGLVETLEYVCKNSDYSAEVQVKADRLLEKKVGEEWLKADARRQMLSRWAGSKMGERATADVVRRFQEVFQSSERHGLTGADVRALFRKIAESDNKEYQRSGNTVATALAVEAFRNSNKEGMIFDIMVRYVRDKSRKMITRGAAAAVLYHAKDEWKTPERMQKIQELARNEKEEWVKSRLNKILTKKEVNE